MNNGRSTGFSSSKRINPAIMIEQMSEVPAVLLIEDGTSILDILRDSTRRDNLFPFSIVKVNTIKEAILAVSQNSSIASVLLDLFLPDNEGINTVSRICERFPHLPVVILSNLEDEQFALKTIQLGAQDYLIKGQFNGGFLNRAIQFAIERKRFLEEVRQREERYSLAVLGSKDGFWDWNLDTDEVYYSPRWKAMLGYEPNEIGNDLSDWFGRIHPDDYQPFRQALNENLTDGIENFDYEYRILRKGGAYLWILCRGTIVRDDEDRPYRISGFQTDITLRKLAELQLHHAAMHDTLTGLPNRSYFLKELKGALDRAGQFSDYIFAALFLDLDYFKEINDSYGHIIGDELLNIVAYRLQACIRPHDTVARLGGDEFVILLDNIENTQTVNDVANRIQTSLHMPFMINGIKLTISASIGITMYKKHYERAEDLIHDADKAMYLAKKGGRNRSVLYDGLLYSKAPESSLNFFQSIMG